MNMCLGCTLCERSYSSDCPDHGSVTFIPDTPIQSRARLSLPRPLCLRVSVADEPNGQWTYFTLLYFTVNDVIRYK